MLLHLLVPVIGRFDSILVKYFALKMYKQQYNWYNMKFFSKTLLMKSLFQRHKTWSVIKCNKIERREGKWDKAREDIQIYPKWEIREDNINTVVRGKHAYVKWFLVSSFVQSLSFRLLTHEPSHVPTPSPQPIIPRSTILPSIHSRFQKIHFTTLMNNLVISNSSINNSP